MYIQQLYTNCLAEAAYYIESEGEAAVIDPIRETEAYEKLAAERGAKIKYVFETHFHADFVSGHIDLAKRTGAQIVYGPMAETGYTVHNAKDGEEFMIGKITIKVLHTPGHTLESSCYLLLDEHGKEHAIFTGDTLFVGDVGRPDLLDGVATKEELAGHMFESLQKLKMLPDEVLVYPAHGPGSSCGKNIGKETWSTIGQQKQSNYAMLIKDKAQFIPAITEGLSAPPAYFFADAAINKNGYESVYSVIERNNKALTLDNFKQELKAGALILDVRNPDEFSAAYIPDSLNISLDGTFALWVGALVDIKKPLVLVAAVGREEETILRLARVGYENVKGYLEGGVTTWKNAGGRTESIENVDAKEFMDSYTRDGYAAVDVRKPGEVANGAAPGAIALTLQDFPQMATELPKDKKLLVYCGGGYRSMMACSILRQQGYTDVTNVVKGYGAIKELLPSPVTTA